MVRAIRDGTIESWPTVIYYLMGANRWRVCDEWPPREICMTALYSGYRRHIDHADAELGPSPGRFMRSIPTIRPRPSAAAFLSYLYTPGSVDVSEGPNPFGCC